MTIEIINPLALLIPKKKTQKPKSPPKKKPQNKSAKQLDLTEHKHLETFFQDRMTMPIDDYRSGTTKKKEAGVSAGFIGKYNESQYMLKPGSSKPIEPNYKNGSEYMNKTDLMQEYITSALYSRILYDRAPIIGLASTEISKDDSEKSKLYLKSKFLKDFRELASVEESTWPSLEGFEKVISACLFLGETDYHSQNLGVVDGKIVKIDHGRSNVNFYDTEANLRKDLHLLAIQDFKLQRLKLNTTRLIEAIDYQAATISDEEIEKIVKAQTYRLKKAGFKPNEKLRYHNGAKWNFIEITSYEELEQFYITKYKSQRERLKELSSTLSTISQIEFSTNPQEQLQWQNGKWLEDIKDKDPLEWAAKHNKKINGKDALIVCIEQNKRFINNQSPLVWAVINNRRIANQPPILWAQKNGKKIEGLPPIDYAATLIKEYGSNNPTLETTVKKELYEAQKELGKEIRTLGLKRFIDKESIKKREELIIQQEKIGEILRSGHSKTFAGKVIEAKYKYLGDNRLKSRK